MPNSRERWASLLSDSRQTSGIAWMVLLISVGILSGCGSSTSSREATAVTVAEARFLKQWGDADQVASRRCSGKRGSKGAACIEDVGIPRQARAMARFDKAVEALLDSGVGPECAEALEDALAASNSIPSFPGETSAICRAESQK